VFDISLQLSPTQPPPFSFRRDVSSDPHLLALPSRFPCTVSGSPTQLQAFFDRAKKTPTLFIEGARPLPPPFFSLYASGAHFRVFQWFDASHNRPFRESFPHPMSLGSQVLFFCDFASLPAFRGPPGAAFYVLRESLQLSARTRPFMEIEGGPPFFFARSGEVLLWSPFQILLPPPPMITSLPPRRPFHGCFFFFLMISADPLLTPSRSRDFFLAPPS